MDLSPRRIANSIRVRSRLAGDAILFRSGLADWLNARETPWVISHRPAFHRKVGLPGYRELLANWTAGPTKVYHAGDLPRFYAIVQNVAQVLRDGVPGDFVELGVYQGNSAAVLAALAREHQRRLFLFDTFEGFDPRDLAGGDAHHKSEEFSDTALDVVRRRVGEDLVTFVKGFFPASLADVDLPDTLAVAHLDCDLAEPTRAGLEAFYPRISPGGVLILHDYASGWWPAATAAIDAFFADKPEKPVLIPDLAGTAIVRKV